MDTPLIPQETPSYVKFGLYALGLVWFSLGTVALIVSFLNGSEALGWIPLGISVGMLLASQILSVYWYRKGSNGMEDSAQYYKMLFECLSLIVLSASLLAVLYGPQPPEGLVAGGFINGKAQSVVLTNNGQRLSLSSQGCTGFNFAGHEGDRYNVQVASSDPASSCSVTFGAGELAHNVANINVTCQEVFTLGGTVQGQTSAVELTHVENGDKVEIQPGQTSFTFAQGVIKGAQYNIRVTSGNCQVTPNPGIASSNVQLSVVCA